METAGVDKVFNQTLQLGRVVAQAVQRLVTLQPLPAHHPQLLQNILIIPHL
jgi:hypothetical protein